MHRKAYNPRRPKSPAAGPAAAPAAAPAESAAGRVDKDLVQRAYRKLMNREALSREERAALKRHEKDKDERLRWEHYGSIPQKHWKQMSGRQTKVINEQ